MFRAGKCSAAAISLRVDRYFFPLPNFAETEVVPLGGPITNRTDETAALQSVGAPLGKVLVVLFCRLHRRLPQSLMGVYFLKGRCFEFGPKLLFSFAALNGYTMSAHANTTTASGDLHLLFVLNCFLGILRC